MSNGFGFRPEDPDDDSGSDSSQSSSENSSPGFDINQVFEQMRAMGIPTPELPDHVKDQLNALTAMAQGMLSGAQNSGGSPFNLPVNVIRDISRKTLAESGERPVGHLDNDAMKGAIQLAALWLDEVTALPSQQRSESESEQKLDQSAASRSEWINYSIDGWQSFTTPLVEGIAEAMERMIGSNSGEQLFGENVSSENVFGNESMQGIPFPLPNLNISQMMAGFMGTMIRTQLGRSIGKFATTVTSANDAAIPLSGSNQSFLIPENVKAWGEGLGIDEREVEIYLALREVAAAQLFAATPWLQGYLHELVSRYGKGINIDVESMQRQAEDALSRGDIDPTDPASMQNAIAQGVFTPEESDEQRAALSQLELILALIEGWIDLMVVKAAGERLPSLIRLQETQRRRRATQSPTQQLFASLIGLEVSPRTIRECANFWNLVTERLSAGERDRLWEDPYALPTLEEIADPENFLKGRTVPDDLSGLMGN